MKKSNVVSPPSPNRRKFAAIVLTLASTLGVLAWWAQAPKQESSEQAKATQTVDDVARDWSIGKQVVYSARWSSRAETVGHDPDTGKDAYEVLSRIEWEARLSITRVPSSELGHELVAQLTDIHVSASGVGDETLPNSELVADLGHAFSIHLLRNGQVQRIGVPNAGTASLAVFKSVASLLQRVHPPDAGPKWTVVEPDPTGKVRVRYEQSGKRLDKAKLNYVELVKPKDPEGKLPKPPEVTVVKSQHSFVLGSSLDAPPEALDVVEETTVQWGGELANMHSWLEFHLTRDQQDSILSQEDALALVKGDWKSASIDQLPPPEAQQKDKAQASVAGRTVTELTTAIRGLESATTRDRRGEARVFSALVSKLRSSSDALKESVASIRAGKDQTVLLDALGSVGTPEAQAALVALLNENRLEHEQTRSSLIKLSMTPSPTPETVSALRDRTTDPKHANQAWLGLGSAAHALSDQEPQRSIEIVKELETRVASADTPSAKETGLRALGNAGNELSLDTCEAYLRSEYLNVRLAAVACARQITGPRADAIIAVALGDSDERMVRGGIDAARNRAYSSILATPLVAIALGPRSRTARILATQIIGLWQEGHPELVAALMTLAAEADDPELRAYAQKLVQS